MSSAISSTFRPPVPISGDLKPQRWVIMGDPGVGKTTLALTFPRVCHLDIESSLEGDAIVGVDGDEWHMSQYRDLNALYTWLKKNSAKYDTIVIDTVDVLCQFLLNEATDEPGNSRGTAEERAADSDITMHQMLVPEQRDYLALAKAMDRFLIALRMLNKHVVLLSHVREPNPEKGETKRKIDTPPSVAKLVYAWATVVGELVIVPTKPPTPKPVGWKPEQVRVLLTQPGDGRRVTKSRFASLTPAVKDPTFAVFQEKILGATATQEGAE